MKEICMQVEDERRHADQFKEQVRWHCTPVCREGPKGVVLKPVIMHVMQCSS